MAREGDWTRGPAKWGAVVVLGVLCIGGIGWSVAKGLTPWRGERAAAEAGAETPAAGGDDSTATRPRGRPAAEKVAVKVNINTADKAELELLPGIGPALAERILDERKRSGPFKRVEDLGRVKGIGPKTIERLRERVVVEAASTSGAK